ncbi:PREDICTED: uncharacterized protein LOC109381060 [Hipposideros armiger]|uniref:Uncharacterized protein LOC109381060 n=1 Tax=Hipposideros armiger TaxID=186990 RepID=A0A8B7R1J7_HIPAR|nr:PREDICTED: uncharacterized protein LOC109381060 [Hipposideros armiger]
MGRGAPGRSSGRGMAGTRPSREGHKLAGAHLHRPASCCACSVPRASEPSPAWPCPTRLPASPGPPPCRPPALQRGGGLQATGASGALQGPPCPRQGCRKGLLPHREHLLLTQGWSASSTEAAQPGGTGHLGQQGADAGRPRARGTPSWASCPHRCIQWGWSPNPPPAPLPALPSRALLKTNSTRGPAHDTHVGGLSRAVPSAADPGCGGRAQQVCPLRLLGSPLSGCPTAWLPRADLLFPQAPRGQQRPRGPGISRCLAVGTAQVTGGAGEQRGWGGLGPRRDAPQARVGRWHQALGAEDRDGAGR